MNTKEKAALAKQIIKKVEFQLAMSIMLAGLTAWWIIPYAYATRGYFAIGGEYCLIIEMGALPWLIKGVRTTLMESIFTDNDKEN